MKEDEKVILKFKSLKGKIKTKSVRFILTNEKSQTA